MTPEDKRYADDFILLHLELGDRVFGHLHAENSKYPHRRYRTVYDRALPKYLRRRKKRKKLRTDTERDLHYEWRRERSCTRKRKHETFVRARGAAMDYRNNYGSRPVPYKCEFCDGYHIGHNRKGKHSKARAQRR